MLDIYTDGSSVGNPGPSGWACCLEEHNMLWILSGGISNSTNNRMELLAVIEAIQFIEQTDIMIHTDSQLIFNCGKGIWKRKANLDLWDLYDKVSKNRNIKWTWVKAHNGNPLNELVDKIARNEANNIKNKNIVS
jgi:ribonuclease HI